MSEATRPALPHLSYHTFPRKYTYPFSFFINCKEAPGWRGNLFEKIFVCQKKISYLRPGSDPWSRRCPFLCKNPRDRFRNTQFEKYIDQIFREELEGNTLNLHYTLAYPEDYGIKGYSVSLGTMEPEALEGSLEETRTLNKKLKNFDSDQLSEENQIIMTFSLLNFLPGFLLAVPICSRSPLALTWGSRPSFLSCWQNILSGPLPISKIIFLSYPRCRNISRASWTLKKKRQKKGCS